MSSDVWDWLQYVDVLLELLFCSKGIFLNKSKTYFYLRMIRENPETDSIQTEDDQPCNGKKARYDPYHMSLIMYDVGDEVCWWRMLVTYVGDGWL